MNIKLLRDLLTQRILFLDGAMGTEIQKFDLQNHDGNNDLLSLTNPKVISQIHEQYLIAGSDIIETNTFNANAISQKDYKNNISIFELNKTSATIAKELCKKYSSQAKPRFVAGAVGPTNISLSLSPDVNNQQYRAASFDELVSAYKEQILGLISGGVDLILVETIFDILNCRAAILAKHLAEQELSAAEILPIILSVTIDKFGRLLTGQTVETFLTSIKHTEGLIAIGFNCGLGAKELELQLQKLVEIKNRIAPELFISIYPNAGLPNENGTYDETAEEFVDTICKHSGLFNIVGGCCGTTPKHIELLNKKIGQTKNIQRSHAIPSCSANIGITLVGERTNINGSRKFLNTICNSDYNQAVDIAQQQIKDGAQIIDINLDNVLLPLETISTFLNILNCDPEISQIPFMLDSSNWETITRGIKHLIVKGIINSISLKNGEDDFIEKAKFIKLFGHQVVVMAIDEVGQATTEERKIEICSRAYNILTTKVNFPAKDIIFDTNILPIGTGIPEHNNYAIAFLSAVRWVKSNLPHAKTIAGLSNISFAFRGNDHLRKSIHSVFLHHATLFGLDFAILNPAQLLEYNNIDPQLKIKIENIIFNLSNNATE